MYFLRCFVSPSQPARTSKEPARTDASQPTSARWANPAIVATPAMLAMLATQDRIYAQATKRTSRKSFAYRLNCVRTQQTVLPNMELLRHF
jgi:hypothetical protein